MAAPAPITSGTRRQPNSIRTSPKLSPRPPLVDTEPCALPLPGLGVGSSDSDKIGTAGVAIQVSNASKVFFHDVEVRIHLKGDVRGIEWRSGSISIAEVELDLPLAPREWGPVSRNPLGSLPFDFGQTYSGAAISSSYRSPLDWTNSGSVDLTLDVGDLRPRQTYAFDDDELVLVLPPTANDEVRGTWEITARDHNEIYSGELAVQIGPHADLTTLVRKILELD